MPSPDLIAVAQLSRLLGTPSAPIVIDVCLDEDFDQDPRLIPTALRHPFDAVESLVPSLSGRRVVVVCQKGLKLSQGAAAMLRVCGIAAEALEGGMAAWRTAGQPTIPLSKIPCRPSHGSTVWVSRYRPKVDRIACPWLIRRFVDPDARFLFVAPSEVLLVAERFSATPFDVPDVFWSHRGDRCTFDIMIEEFEVATQALSRLAAIVRGADTDRHDLAPQASGLLAASVGLSRMYRNDLDLLDAGMALYDAFYRWARDAADEGHNWQPVRTGV